jgi:hypothetical protein
MTPGRVGKSSDAHGFWPARMLHEVDQKRRVAAGEPSLLLEEIDEYICDFACECTQHKI